MGRELHLPIVSTAPAEAPLLAEVPRLLVDTQGRQVTYLRISLTDRCNYRCAYCMPDDLDHLAAEELLDFDRIERLVRLFAGLGVRRIRLTGGEPTIRKGLTELVARLARVPGIEEVVMTTNGHLLAELAGSLAAAGLAGLNVSLDSLDPERFRRLTGRGDLDRVMAGVAAARAAGLPTKINAVAIGGENEHELGALCRWAWSQGAEPRFIEWMPMSGGALYQPARLLGAATIRQELMAQRGGAALTPLPAARPHHGPARRWQHPEGTVGIISAMTEHFCAACNRVRLSARGALHPCLAHDDAVDLAAAMHAGLDDDELARIIGGALIGKRDGHDFHLDGSGGPRKAMVAIGG
jgi:cyclic pyranopterin phosphate synthase